MSDPPAKPPPQTAAGKRQQRLAAALRANLARRKAQARGRGAAQPEAEPPAKEGR